MKIRSDFVTNSSSSSFVVARKGPLNEALREAAVHYVENFLLGEEVRDVDTLSIGPESPEEKEKVLAQAKQLVEEGWTISAHDREVGSGELYEIYHNAWIDLKKADPKAFRTVEVSLDY